MIWLEESQYCMRIIDADPAQRPPYRAVGTIVRHGDVVILKGFVGRVRRADIVEFIAKMREMGVRHILLERAGIHKMPLSKLIDGGSGLFSGWRHIDINDLSV